MMPGKPPYYESRFVRANHPDRAIALWLRETLLLPTVGESVADVWVMIFDPEGAGNRALKVGHPMEVADYRYGNGAGAWNARIGDTSIDDRSVRGSVTVGLRSAAWELCVEPGGELPVKLLTERGYRAPFPTAKTLVRHPLATFDGRVELDDARLDLEQWTGSVNHNWGRRHTPGYVRAGMQIRRCAGVESRDRDRPRRGRTGLAGGDPLRVAPRRKGIRRSVDPGRPAYPW